MRNESESPISDASDTLVGFFDSETGELVIACECCGATAL